MLINITQQHIKNGKRKQSDRCPAALAIKEKLYPGVHVSVGLPHIFFTTEYGPIYTVPQPVAMSDWVSQYDGWGKVEPAQFEIDVPDAITLGE